MGDRPEYIDGLPNICGPETHRRGHPGPGRRSRLPAAGDHRLRRLNSAFAIALHMHQPLIPAGGSNLRTAEMISNLKHMMDNPGIGDNHNASVFHWCYKRMGDFIPQLMDEGKQPRDHAGLLGHAAARPAPDGR